VGVEASIAACDWGLMKNPGNPEELADAIESLVVSYMDEVRLAAQRAVERSLTRGSVSRPPSKVRDARRTAPRSRMARRSRPELDAACEQLCQVVRARPGESMVTLAGAMGMPMSTLQGPMAKLRADGRVRSVGERHLTRYFPAVVRAAAGKE
jgi:DNA-binding NtrC family response regulator